MVKGKIWIVKNGFHGKPKPEDFEVIEEDVAEVQDGEFLAVAEWWSVDPYQRAYINQSTPPNFKMFGFQVAKVTESKCDKFKVGDYIVAHWGWRTHTISNADGVVRGFEQNMPSAPYAIHPSLTSVPRNTMIGLLGMPGMTAYFGVTELLKPKAGETLLVNGGAGAVGMAVGQLGKILGCNVVGYAGSDDKVAWMKNELGFDHAFNYKTVDLDQTLKEAAPKGVDCFFDNVGGDFASTVYPHLTMDSRICQCGAISVYNAIEPPRVPDFRMLIVMKRVTLAGLHVSKYTDQFPQGIAVMAKYLMEGKLKNRDTIWNGFDNIPTAFMEMLQGKNTGKAVVKA